MSETTALVPVHVGIRLSSLDEAKELSKVLAVASVMPNSLRGKPADVLAILLYGQEIGLSPMQSAQGIYVVNGRPTLAAQTWIALARRAGHRLTVVEHTDETCTVEIVRGDTGETHRETYSLDEARQAKLAEKDVWKQYPKRMTLARAVSNACRFACPEIALGFYSEADVDDLREVPDPEVVAPLGSDIQDAEIVDPADVKDELDALADQFDFSHAAEQEELSGDVDE